jgi:hypothetical protein
MKFSSSNFSSDAEGEQSYVYLFPGQINDIKLRGLKKRTLLAGHLVVHSLLLVSFLFSGRTKQTDFMNEYFKCLT